MEHSIRELVLVRCDQARFAGADDMPRTSLSHDHGGHARGLRFEHRHPQRVGLGREDEEIQIGESASQLGSPEDARKLGPREVAFQPGTLDSFTHDHDPKILDAGGPEPSLEVNQGPQVLLRRETSDISQPEGVSAIPASSTGMKEVEVDPASENACRVRVYERTIGGPLYARTWDPTIRSYRQVALEHSNRERAKDYALEQAEALRKGQDELLTGSLTLARLFRLYMEHRSPRKSAEVQKADKRRVDLFKGVLGAERDAKRVTPRDWQEFIDARREGQICGHGEAGPHERPDKTQCPGPTGRRVGPRTIATDLAWLRAVYNWAVDWSDAEGRRLLSANPVRGYEMPREKNPRRPLATADQLEALLQVSDQVTMEVVPEHPLHPEYGLKTDEPKKLATVRSYLRELLILTNGTGRRIGAVRTLTFADLRLDVKPWGAIHWPAHSDKAGYESTAEISVEVRAVLDAILDERPGAGSAPLFPAPSDPTKPVDKYFTDKLRQRGIALARRKAREEGRAFELPSRWGFHSFRRKFATELKTAPDKDVADLGGWRDVNTLRQVYQRSDHESRVAALMNRLELREAKG